MKTTPPMLMHVGLGLVFLAVTRLCPSGRILGRTRVRARIWAGDQHPSADLDWPALGNRRAGHGFRWSRAC